MKTSVFKALTASLIFASLPTLAGPMDPECTPEKAAKSAAAKSTVGVGGRCSAGEAASDSAKKAAGIEDKGPLDKKGKDKDDKDLVKGAVKTVK